MRRGCTSFHDSGGHAGMIRKRLRSVVFLAGRLNTSDEPNERAQKEYRHKTAVIAQFRKPIPPKKTGLAAGNKSLINTGSRRSALVTNRQTNSYLAINWQRTGADERFTSRGHRFP